MNLSRLKKLLIPDDRTLQVQMLALYVANHMANRFLVVFVCFACAGILAQWSPHWFIGLWLLVTVTTSVVSARIYARFEKAMPIVPEAMHTWLWMLGVPRLIFIIAWSSVLLWGWDEAEPTTVYIPFIMLIVTMAVNAATSGPFLPFYFMEIVPKALVMFAMMFGLGGPVNNAVGLLLPLAILFIVRLAFKINATARTLFRQKNELAEALDSLQMANRAKSAFLAMVSHEIRTPLNGIIGLATLLKDTRLTKEQSEYVDTIDYSGTVLQTMMNDILDFSKLESGKLSVEMLSFNPRHLIKGVTDLTRPRAEEKNLRMEYRVDGNVPHIVCSDPLRLRQVILNLVTNAIKFTETGSIVISLSVNKSGALRGEVADTGPGIDKATQGLLFKEFSQADSSTARLYGGTGLGLAICKRIITLLEGKIGLESAPGEGSLFWFEAPLKNVEDAAGAYQPENRHISYEKVNYSLNVLLVDDNHINRQVAKGMLERLGHRVTLAESGDEAIEAVKGYPFRYDLIFMDVQMPGKDGLETTRDIRMLGARYREIPIVALTANTLPADIERCLQAGMVDHVGKPVDAAAMGQAIARHAVQKKEMDEADHGLSEDNIMVSLHSLEKDLGLEYACHFFDEGIKEVRRLYDVLKTMPDDTEVMTLAAHDLKSMSAMIGLREIAQLAHYIQAAAGAGDLGRAAQLIRDMGQIFEPSMRIVEQKRPVPVGK